MIMKDPEKVGLGGVKKELSIFFLDIRNFTTISEKLPPADLIKMVNRLFKPMTEIILRHKGTIDKYIGDCIMAFWNAPLDDTEHARNACRASLEIYGRFRDEKLMWLGDFAEENQDIDIHIGIGLNTGDAVVGNMGSEQRVNYSTLGDSVNLAARTEGISRNYGLRC